MGRFGGTGGSATAGGKVAGWLQGATAKKEGAGVTGEVNALVYGVNHKKRGVDHARETAGAAIVATP